MVALWEEYEAAQTPEAQYVKDLDKLEMILQAEEYEETQDVDLQQFFDNTQDVFKTEKGSEQFKHERVETVVLFRKEMAEEVRSQRLARKAKQNHHN